MRSSLAVVTVSLFGLAHLACGSSDDSPGPTPGASSAATGTGGGGGQGGDASGGDGVGGGGGSPDACAAFEATMDQSLADMFPSTKSQGAVIAVVTPECRWIGAAGQSTDDVAMSPEHVLRIGSVTKTYVSARLLQLVADGALSLDDSLDAWLPDLPGGAEITVRQLMNHSSGLFNYTDDGAFIDSVLDDPKAHRPPQELVDVAMAHEPYFAPGTSFHYSNTNYILLGMVVETITGATLGAEIRDSVLAPTELSATFFDGEEEITADLAHGYAEGDFDVSTYFDPSWAWAAGAMVASAGDVADWARNLYGGRVLGPASKEALFDAIETDNAQIGYGLGVMVFSPSIAGTDAVGHFGDIPGYHTQMLYLLEQDTAIVSIVNTDGGNPNPLTAGALDILLE